MKNGQQPQKSSGWATFVRVVVCGLLGAALLMGWAVHKMFSVDPERLYTSEFVTPRENIQHLEGDGQWFQGGDAWMRFDSAEKVQLRESEKYVPGKVTDARHAIREELVFRPWYATLFSQHERDMALLSSDAGFTCVYKQLNQYQEYNRATLLHHRASGAYYFRVRNHK
jgi:hypothetical protein